MQKTVKCGLILGLILLVGVFFAGCSDQSSGTYTPVTTTTTPTAHYSAGDIVAKTASQSPFWLILSYDSTTDQYSRALIYKNTDGSWGHRNDASNDTLVRASMEKLYPVKVSHVDLSSVPIVTPTVPTAVPTTLLGSGPRITAVSPASAAVNTPVSLTITGTNFLPGATVSLTQPGSPTIQATGVSVTTSQITCMANLNGLSAGILSIRVTNPDRQYDELDNGFTIGAAPPGITSVVPATGGLGLTVSLTITGTNFENPATVTLSLAGATNIVCQNTVTTPPSQITCSLPIPSTATTGGYNLTVLNSGSGKSATWNGVFSVINATA
jgi:hypothetical protein